MNKEIQEIEKEKLFFEIFLRHLMKKGEKAKALNIMFETLKNFEERDLVLEKVFQIIRPYVEVRNVRMKQGSVAVPFPTTLSRQYHLVAIWLIESAKTDKRKLSFAKKLSDEIRSILDNKGTTLKKKETVYQLALKNRSNLHYRWY